MLKVCTMQACVAFPTWINSSQSSWSNPFTSDPILIGDRAASLSVDLPLSGDGINSCLSSSSSSARSSQSVALISCHRFRRSIPLHEIIIDEKHVLLIKRMYLRLSIIVLVKECVVMTEEIIIMLLLRSLLINTCHTKILGILSFKSLPCFTQNQFD